MPTLPLSPGFSVVLGGGDLPVTSSADALATLPAFMQPSVPAPVRDALLSSLAALLIRHQELSGYASAQSDILRATDQYLVGLAEDRGFFQQATETQDQFRARCLAVPALVTPAAVVTIANAILAGVTAVQAQYLESALDRLFIFDGTQPSTLHSFVGPVSPQYLDRMYRDDAAANGVSVANRDPGGGWIFGDEIGRYFVLRVPLVADSDIALSFGGFDVSLNPILLASVDLLSPELGGTEPAAFPALTGNQLPPTSGGRGLFIADGTNTSNSEADGSVATFLWQGGQSALSIYQTIVNSIERIKGQGVRWQLFVDSALTS